MLKKICLTLALVVIQIASASGHVAAQNSYSNENVTAYVFYSNTCPHCANEHKFLTEIQGKYPNLKIRYLEVTTSTTNLNLFQKVGLALNKDVSGVPFFVIGNKSISGFMSKETTGKMMEQLISEATRNPSQVYDVVKAVETTEQYEQKTETKQSSQSTSTENSSISIPILGNINPKTFSLPVLTVVIGLLDGFNPCAMWVLLFLISILLGTQNRKRMWFLGTTFILASGLVYYLFMAAWLNFFIFVGYSTFVRYIIGVTGIAFGFKYIKDYVKNPNGGCEVTADEKRTRMFERIKRVINKNNLFFAFLGMISLAFAVNLVELLCSAGLPAVFTQVLSLRNLPWWQNTLYMMGYIFFYLLEQIIVFVFAMVTLETMGISHKYARYSHLFGGIVILILGILLVLRPDILI